MARTPSSGGASEKTIESSDHLLGSTVTIRAMGSHGPDCQLLYPSAGLVCNGHIRPGEAEGVLLLLPPDISAELPELLLDTVVPPIKMVDPPDRGFPLGRQCGNNQ